jgi:hypothetical protein
MSQIINMLKTLVFLSVSVTMIYAMSGGAPDGACGTFRPQHFGTNEAELTDLDPGFELIVSAKVGSDGRRVALRTKIANAPVRLTIKCNDKDKTKPDEFKGFFVQSFCASTHVPMGNFVLPKENPRMKYVVCNETAPESTVTHTDSQDKKQVNLSWRAPPTNDLDREYYFKYTVVKDYATYYVGRTTEPFRL